jgi:hypothetical protein
MLQPAVREYPDATGICMYVADDVHVFSVFAHKDKKLF